MNKRRVKRPYKEVIFRLFMRTLILTNLYTPAKAIYEDIYPLFPNGRRQKVRMLQFYRQFIKPNSLCFDVGANIGNRTEIFLKLGAKVVTIEPQKACMKRLQRKFRRSDKVSLVQKAVSEQEGEHQMMVANTHTLSSLSPIWVKCVSAYRKAPWH